MDDKIIYDEVRKKVDITYSAFKLAISDYTVNNRFNIWEFIEWLKC